MKKINTKLPVYLCDLDVINPYFRSRDYENHLKSKGVQLVAPKGDLIKADLPIVTGEVYSVINDMNSHIILDVGGDKDGAIALGQFAHLIKAREYDFLFVANSNRPYVSNVRGILDCIEAVEKASRLKVTGLINNTHLGDEMVDPDNVVEGEKNAREAAEQLNIPFLFTTISEDTWNEWRKKEIQPNLQLIEIFERKLLTPWNL